MKKKWKKLYFSKNNSLHEHCNFKNDAGLNHYYHTVQSSAMASNLFTVLAGFLPLQAEQQSAGPRATSWVWSSQPPLTNPLSASTTAASIPSLPVSSSLQQLLKSPHFHLRLFSFAPNIALFPGIEGEE